jgi:hypothetical protein
VCGRLRGARPIPKRDGDCRSKGPLSKKCVRSAPVQTSPARVVGDREWFLRLGRWAAVTARRGRRRRRVPRRAQGRAVVSRLVIMLTLRGPATLCAKSSTGRPMVTASAGGGTCLCETLGRFRLLTLAVSSSQSPAPSQHNGSCRSRGLHDPAASFGPRPHG